MQDADGVTTAAPRRNMNGTELIHTRVPGLFIAASHCFGLYIPEGFPEEEALSSNPGREEA